MRTPAPELQISQADHQASAPEKSSLQKERQSRTSCHSPSLTPGEGHKGSPPHCCNALLRFVCLILFSRPGLDQLFLPSEKRGEALYPVPAPLLCEAETSASASHLWVVGASQPTATAAGEPPCFTLQRLDVKPGETMAMLKPVSPS